MVTAVHVHADMWGESSVAPKSFGARSYDYKFVDPPPEFLECSILMVC